MAFKVSYISAACNQTPHIAHWGRNNLICYGSCNAVLIYDLNVGGGKIIHTLHEHTKRINAVKWITGCEFETELVSVGTDSKTVIWTYKNGEYVPTVILGHKGIINVVDALYKDTNKKNAVVVTAADDSTAKIWHRATRNDEFMLFQNLDFGYHICVSLRLGCLPDNQEHVLAVALDTSNIDLYVPNIDGNFEKNISLVDHEDWVCGLDFQIDANKNLLLASSSQDSTVRVFKFIPEHRVKADEKIVNKLTTRNCCYFLKTESVLAGHEGWVFAVNFSNQLLLTSSLDKMIIIWKFQEDLDMWLDSDKVGEVGGNTLGFYGGMFNDDGTGIMAHSYHGAFHIWRKKNELWEPHVTVGGHFGEVIDLAWNPMGEYVISVSCDQTTRIHAPWRKNTNSELTWHEIARPQVHGYDMSCLAVLGRYKFASGAEEKIIRTFHAPDNFVQNFQRLCNVETDIAYSAPKGASVPSLGLSNKAIYENDNKEQSMIKSNNEPYPEESHFQAIKLTEPPTEETLVQNTLWPEIQKLYGHGYELYSIASSPDGKLIASACKATTPEHAAILIWETENYSIIQRLQSHTLTVTQIAFSPNGNNILSVSRDRRWSIFTLNPTTGKFYVAATTDKKTGVHTRIIWSCGWTHDSKYFATGSRDGKVVFWTKNDQKEVKDVLGKYEVASDALSINNQPVTALAFAPGIIGKDYLIAVGLDTGIIHLVKWNIDKMATVLCLDQRFAHHLMVKRLIFRPKFGRTGFDKDEKNMLQLASCSSDFSVRIYDFDINQM